MASTGGDDDKSGKGDYTGGAIDPSKLGLSNPRAEFGPEALFNKPPKSWPELIGAFHFCGLPLLLIGRCGSELVGFDGCMLCRKPLLTPAWG